MYNFFVSDDKKQSDRYYIEGTDYNHIKNVLRMKQGDNILVSCNGTSDLCTIESFDSNIAIVKIVQCNYSSTELPIKIYLFQGLPKSDKMEMIIQKSVELGATDIIPVEMKRSVVKLDDKKKKSKQARWQLIAESAAKQSKRNSIPKVDEPMTYKQALNIAKQLDILLVPYENEDGIDSTKTALSKIRSGMSVGILIGPEGGFDHDEIMAAKSLGGISISLGKRILRTETAAVTSVAMCMLYSEMNLDGDDK